MEIKIDIPNKTLNEIEEMCIFNNISVEDYIFQCVMDNFNTMKYGDLNEKIHKQKTGDGEDKNLEEIKGVEKKKTGRPRKKVEVQESVESTIIDSKERKIIKDDVVLQHVVTKKEETVNTTDSKIENKIKRIRKLNTK